MWWYIEQISQAAVAESVHPVSCFPLVIYFFVEMMEGFHPSQRKRNRCWGCHPGIWFRPFLHMVPPPAAMRLQLQWHWRSLAIAAQRVTSRRWLHQSWAPTGGLGSRGQLADIHCIPTGSVVLSYYIKGTYQDTFPVPRSSNWFGSLIRMMLNQWECIRK